MDIVTQLRSAYGVGQYGGLYANLVMAIVMTLTYLHVSTAQAEIYGQIESLRWLPGVSVAIETIDPEARADGLSEEAVRTAVELILRSSGIRILTNSERITTPSKPYLYVNIIPVKSKGMSSYALSVSVYLRQYVSLVHRPQHTMLATTWQIAYAVQAGSERLEELASHDIEPAIEDFANDFLTVIRDRALLLYKQYL